MRRESVLEMLCGVCAGVLFGLGAGVSTPARAQTSQWEESLPAYRFQLDTRRNRVWVLGLNGVYVYDSRTKKLLQRFELPNWTVVNEPFVCAPDIVIAASGAALVTSNIMPVVWEIDAESMAVRQHKLALDSDNDKDIGFTALSFGSDGRELLGVNSPLGAVWRIDLAAGKAQKLRAPKATPGECKNGNASASQL